MTQWTLALWGLTAFAATSSLADTCPQYRMNPGQNPRAFRSLSVPTSCDVAKMFTCPNGVVITSSSTLGDRKTVGAQCYREGDPELARLRATGRETLTPARTAGETATNGALGPATPGNGSDERPTRRPAADLGPDELRLLRQKSVAAGVPAVIFERALANYQRLKREGRTSRDCFMAADMTTGNYQGRLWQICFRPNVAIQEMPTHFGSGAGPNCKSHVYRNSSSECATYFGNRPGYCLTAGGNYVTASVTRDRGSRRPFVELKGLDTGENDNAGSRNVGIHQTTFHSGKSYLGQTDHSQYSNGCVTIPGSGDTVNPVDLSADGEAGGMALYVYPSKKDVQDYRDRKRTNGERPYWNAACASQVTRPGWIGADPADAPSEAEESNRQLAEWLRLTPSDARP